MKAWLRILLEQLKRPSVLVPLAVLLASAAAGLADPKNSPVPTPS